MKIWIDDSKTVKELQDEFKKEFGGCLHVKEDGFHLAEENATLASIGAKSGNINCNSIPSVEEFQKKALEKCNLHIAVRTPDDWVEVPDPIKLDKVKSLPKSATTECLYRLFLAEIKKSVNKLPVTIPTTVKGKGLPTRYMPTPAEVEKWNKARNMPRKMCNYQVQEAILNNLFQHTYPNNINYEEVLLKVVVLNEFYSTGIINTRYVADRLCSLAVDKKLNSGSMDVVDKIAKVKPKNGNSITFFSFATKYCSFHRPTIYPIYDSFVCKVLTALKKRDGFCKFTEKELRDAETFKHVIDEFERVYNLIDPKTGNYYDYKTLDRYLWLFGKECFNAYK